MILLTKQNVRYRAFILVFSSSTPEALSSVFRRLCCDIEGRQKLIHFQHFWVIYQAFVRVPHGVWLNINSHSTNCAKVKALSVIQTHSFGVRLTVNLNFVKPEHHFILQNTENTFRCSLDWTALFFFCSKFLYPVLLLIFDKLHFCSMWV